jgi:formate transporter
VWSKAARTDRVIANLGIAVVDRPPSSAQSQATPPAVSPSPQDAYPPGQIALLVAQIGVRKATAAAVPTLELGVLAGAFIAFGAMFFTLVMTGSPLGLGPGRLLGGLAFSLGLVLVVIGGAELFTGNNLVVMAWAAGKVRGVHLARNWTLVYVANLVGALGTALMVHWSGTLELGGGAVARTAAEIAQAKVALGVAEAFFRGVLCNILVCLAVWLSYAAHDVAGKILAIVFPISAFVALGFEHSIANMYLIPIAMLAGADGVTVAGFLWNLAPVTLGNAVGGGVFVALVYWLIYLREG